MIFLSGALIFSVIRLLMGPRVPDRVVALDLISIVAIGYVVVYAIRYDQPEFIDVAIVLALVTFLGTISFAYYLERRT
jgi:multicomponent Na+:H+ antiporter subunit F